LSPSEIKELYQKRGTPYSNLVRDATIIDLIYFDWIVDVSSGIEGNLNEPCELLVLNDVTIAIPMLGSTKKPSPSDYMVPNNLMWLNSKPDYVMISTYVDRGFNYNLVVQGPETFWLLGFCTHTTYQKAITALLQMLGLSSISSLPTIRKGSHVFKHEGVYDGKWKSGLFEGGGVWTSEDGTTYTGKWKSSSGFGVISVPGETPYISPWSYQPSGNIIPQALSIWSNYAKKQERYRF